MRTVLHSFLPAWTCLLAGTAALAGQTEAARPITQLTAPREVLFDQDAPFVATLQAETAGAVRFELKTFAGETVWSKSAPVAAGRASIVLEKAEAAKLDKGSRVLAATLDGKQESSVYAPVRLRGRVFRNPEKPPEDLRPGDEIVITNLDRLQPAEAVCDTSTKGKWWRRTYRVPGEPDV